MSIPRKGEKAPAFKANNQDGKQVGLSDYAGKKLVLYFYPKDDTPACTKEACNLRDNYRLLLKKGYHILGISADTEKKHKKFIAKYDLPFDLLADTDQRISLDYGVWVEKSMFGRKFMGIKRTTFIINEKGIIEDVIEDVDTENHAEQIIK